jgi:hypothetical protein
MVPARIVFKIGRSYCQELSYRILVGSAYCPASKVGSWVEAYELTYSYNGPAMTSD